MSRYILSVLCLAIITQSSESQNGEECLTKKTKLYLIAMAPFRDSTQGLQPSWESGPAVIPGIQVAVRHINSRCDVLKGYRLELVVANSGCNETNTAYVNLISTLFGKENNGSNHPVIGIVGPACSATTITIGTFLALESVDLLNIAPSATSPLLVNKTQNANTFRPIASSLSYVRLYSELIQSMKYSKVACLFEIQRIFFTTAANQFQKSLQELGITVKSYATSSNSIPLTKLQNQYRVIFVFCHNTCKKLMCLAYHKKMLYPNYQYIFSDRYIADFIGSVRFHLNGADYNCNDKEMKEATEGILLNLYKLIREDMNTSLVSGMNYKQFEKDYNAALDEYKKELNLSNILLTNHSTGYYDSAWAFALAFNSSMQRFKEEFNKSIDDYGIGHPELTSIVREELLNVEFEGMRGTVTFSNVTHDGENVTIFDIFQIQEEKVQYVGRYDPTIKVKFHLEEKAMLVKYDKFFPVVITAHVYARVIVSVTVVLMAFLTSSLQLANIKWVHAKSLKATSPWLNHMIFSGCYLYLISTVLETLLESSLFTASSNSIIYPLGCSSVVWCESIALTLIFGTIIVKSWRIFRIFSHSSANVVNNLNDYQLVLYVCALLIIDIIFNVMWNLINPWYKHIAAQDELKIRYTCSCDHLEFWFSCFLAIKSLIAIMVLCLSIRNRRIRFDQYKQTKTTNSLVYSLIFIYSLSSPIYIILLNSTSVGLATLSYIALCFKNIAATVLCMVFIFWPPLLPIFKQKIKFSIANP